MYLQVLDAKSDSKDTLMQILHELYQQFIIGQGKKNLVLVADAKLYEILHRVQFENEMVPSMHRCTTSALENIMLGIGCLEPG